MAKIIPFTPALEGRISSNTQMRRLRSSTKRLTHSMFRTAHASMIRMRDTVHSDKVPAPADRPPNLNVAMELAEFVHQAIITRTREQDPVKVHNIGNLALELIREY